MDTLRTILDACAQSPALALFGASVLVALLLAPLMLRIAGLSGAQIIELLRATMTFIITAIRELRSTNNPPPPPQ